ncbi:MAG: oligoribonuclease [Archangium gephyra]|uniref:Oligoribonuclease n=1 Tax=Archangium gephyra TaxID=48 RepID=A0A2W5UNI6_9BACT|nr:MAG: oligoribonuclease [Archangium gephyra]
MTAETRFVWCDLEMTGLDTGTNTIIEMGLIITDGQLKPVAEWEAAIWQPEESLNRMEPFVKDMHTRNGLLERVRKSDISLRVAEREATKLLLQHCDYGEGILCGNSIHTDRAFINRYMPGFDRALHYRMVDVSSLKILTRAWYPSAPGRSKVDAAHTVLSDLRASIGELAYYQQTFFKKSSEV